MGTEEPSREEARIRKAYAKLVEAFRGSPGRLVNRAAKSAGVTWLVANRALTEGFPEYGLEPIRDLLEREKGTAKAITRATMTTPNLAPEVVDHLRDQGLAHARAVLVEEIALLGDMRGAAAKLAKLGHQAMAEAADLIEDIKRRLKKDPEYLSARDKIALIRALLEVPARYAQLTHEAVATERLVLGQPTEIIQLQTKQAGQAVDMTLAEAKARAQNALVAVEESARDVEIAAAGGGLDEGGLIGVRVHAVAGGLGDG